MQTQTDELAEDENEAHSRRAIKEPFMATYAKWVDQERADGETTESLPTPHDVKASGVLHYVKDGGGRIAFQPGPPAVVAYSPDFKDRPKSPLFPAWC